MDGFTAGYLTGSVISVLITTFLFGTVFTKRLRRVRAELGGHIRAQQRAFTFTLRALQAQLQAERTV